MKTQFVWTFGWLMATACATAPLPEALGGAWYPEEGDGIALRFETDGQSSRAFLAFLNRSKLDEVPDWLGPLAVHSAGEGQWRFKLPDLPQEASVARSSLRRNVQYVFATLGENGRVVASAFDQFEPGHTVTVRPDSGDQLLVSGLWQRYQVTEYHRDGSPAKTRHAPVVTRYSRRQRAPISVAAPARE